MHTRTRRPWPCCHAWLAQSTACASISWPGLMECSQPTYGGNIYVVSGNWVQNMVEHAWFCFCYYYYCCCSCFCCCCWCSYCCCFSKRPDVTPAHTAALLNHLPQQRLLSENILANLMKTTTTATADRTQKVLHAISANTCIFLLVCVRVYLCVYVCAWRARTPARDYLNCIRNYFN